jgi:hypothetical protein
MIEAILFFAASLVVGWNLVPQPAWVKNLYERWFTSK